MEFPQRTLRDLRWIEIEGNGTWEKDGEEGLSFLGGEFDPPAAASGAPSQDTLIETISRDKWVNGGGILFDQKFKEGRIKMRVKFDAVDYRSSASIVIQYNPTTKDMLTFGISGGGLKPKPGEAGFQYKFQFWGPPVISTQSMQGAVADQPKVWTTLFQVGVGTNLKAGRAYDLEILVRGSMVGLYVDGIEIGRQNLPVPSLPGQPCGIFCLSHSKIQFHNICVETVPPKAFVVMQFKTQEYEELFRDVIKPVCESEGLHAYRADFTYLPGLIIEDIKKNIQESRIVIAEITPQNPNVYYEVGYADALNKPIILISDQKEGIKPFDVRAYRTIFYENSIGGKNKIENDLRSYIQSIMES